MIQYFFENVEEISLPENCSEWVEKLILNEEKNWEKAQKIIKEKIIMFYLIVSFG